MFLNYYYDIFLHARHTSSDKALYLVKCCIYFFVSIIVGVVVVLPGYCPAHRKRVYLFNIFNNITIHSSHQSITYSSECSLHLSSIPSFIAPLDVIDIPCK